MTKQDLLENILKCRVIAYRPDLIKIFKSLQAGIFLHQMIYWTGKESHPDGWIRKEMAELFDEIGLSRRNQETARKVLMKEGVLEEMKMGSPPKMHYRINFSKLTDKIENYYESIKDQKSVGGFKTSAPDVNKVKTSEPVVSDERTGRHKKSGSAVSSLHRVHTKNTSKTTGGREYTSLSNNKKQKKGEHSYAFVSNIAKIRHNIWETTNGSKTKKYSDTIQQQTAEAENTMRAIAETDELASIFLEVGDLIREINPTLARSITNILWNWQNPKARESIEILKNSGHDIEEYTRYFLKRYDEEDWIKKFGFTWGMFISSRIMSQFLGRKDTESGEDFIARMREQIANK